MSANNCSNCGAELNAGAKFCPFCGNPVQLLQAVQEKPKLDKGKSKSLKESVQSIAKPQVWEKIADQDKQHIQSAQKPSPQPVREALSSSAAVGFDKFGSMGFLILNLLLLGLGYQSDTVLGILFLSFVAGVFMIWRRKKPKPINWLIKIILILQVIGLLAVVVDSIEYLGLISGLMILLLGIDLKLIFKGNRSN